MLKIFKFKNCYSFRDEAVLNMEADEEVQERLEKKTYTVREKPLNEVIEVCGNYKLLPIAAVYGKNAGGKSNIIFALRDCINNITGKENQVVPSNPFWLTTNKLDSRCTYTLILMLPDSEFVDDYPESSKRIEYIYSYTVDESGIVSESLSTGGAQSPSFIFSRKRGKNHDIIKANKDIKEQISKFGRKDFLFLTSFGKLYNNTNGEIPYEIIAVYEWCKNVIVLDHGISSRDVPAGVILDNLSPINEVVRELDDSIFEVRRAEDDKHSVRVIHKYNSGKQEKEFILDWESSGTRRAINMAYNLQAALKKGKTLIVDELDASLHPVIFQKIVSMFNDIYKTGKDGVKSKNYPKKGQLIFTAHNTIVMDLNTLRVDEIHIVDKNKNAETTNIITGVSEIERFSNFRHREDDKPLDEHPPLDKIYLNGLLGSIAWSFIEKNFDLGEDIDNE